MARNKALVPKGLEDKVDLINSVAKTIIASHGKGPQNSSIFIDILREVQRQGGQMSEHKQSPIIRIAREIIENKRPFVRVPAPTKPKTHHKTNSSKIVLADGKQYELLRLRGDSSRASELLWHGPRHEELISKFMFESGAGSDYVARLVANKASDIYFLMNKNEPVGFFSLKRNPKYKNFILGSVYINQEFRRPRPMELGKSNIAGNGQRLVEFALRTARNMGAPAVFTPEMTYTMQGVAAKVLRGNKIGATVSRLIKNSTFEANEASGDDWIANFNKRNSRNERRKKAQSQQFRHKMH